MDVQKEPDVSICLVNYNQKRWLESVFATIKKTEYGSYTITFLDNSSDGSVAWVKENHPDVTAIDCPSNSGFAGGNNICIKNRKADYYVVHDMDIDHMDALWLKKMIDKLEENPKNGIAGGVIVPMHLKPKLDIAKVHEILPSPMKAHMISGSLMVVKQKVIEDIGLMDEDYFIYWEETDFQYRALMKGYHVWYVDAPYWHFSGSSTNLREQSKTTLFKKNKVVWQDDAGKLKPRGFYYYYRNELMFNLIIYGNWRLLKGLGLLFLRTGYHSTLKFHPAKVKAMWDSWKYIFQNRKKILSKRKDVQSTRIVGDREIEDLRKAKNVVSHKLDAYYKQVEAELIKEEAPLERTFYH